MSDNTTATYCINKMGTSHSMECHHEVLKIWERAIIYKNHLSAAHIPGKLNTVVGKESRSNHIDTEWMLQPHPMWKKMNMLVVHLSGSLQKANQCQEMLLKYYQLHEEW